MSENRVFVLTPKGWVFAIREHKRAGTLTHEILEGAIEGVVSRSPPFKEVELREKWQEYLNELTSLRKHYAPAPGASDE